MKRWGKILALILGVCLLFGQCPIQGLALEEQAGGTVEVTRLEWLKALTSTFQMTVEEDNYPDNYFSDINADSEDYYDVMLATEFGLVDVEAGEALRPDDAATREFAAHTLNLCMGYFPQGESYTFSEVGAAKYPEDIQVAIEKGWLTLSGSNFLPDQGITAAEKEKMISIAAEAVAAVTIGDEKFCQYQLAEGVIAIPEDIEAALTGDNELTLYDGDVNIEGGDIFAVFSGGFPIAYKAVTVTHVDNVTVIHTENVDTEAAFISLETQGSLQGDLSKVQAASDEVELAYIVGGTEEQDYEDGITYYSLDEVGGQEVTAVVATRNFETTDKMWEAYSLSSSVGENISASCKISNPDAEWDISVLSQKAYVKVSVDVTFSLSINTGNVVDLVLDDFFKPIPIGVVGYIKPEVEAKAEGKIALCGKNTLSIGISWSGKDGIRPIADSKKESFTIQSSVAADLGIKVAVGVNVGIVKAELYARAGGHASLEITTYTDDKTPFECRHIKAYMYASYGGEVSINAWVFKNKFELGKDIFDEKNSPVKVALHYEDGRPVEECTSTRGLDVGEGGSGIGSGAGSGSGKKYKYYTPINSQYAYSGLNSGTSSTGQPYTIFEYSLDGDNKATITKYNGNVAALNIPETIDGYTVVGIGQDVFKNNSRIQLVTMPDTVTEIGSSAFSGCSNLSNVTLSKSLIRMGYYAFRDCDSLTSITIPKSLQETTHINRVYQGVFADSDNLKTVFFEEGVTKIPEALFANSSIEEIMIPDTVTVIEESAFAGCGSLKKVKLSEHLTSIGNNAFEDAKALTEIQIPDTVTEIEISAFSGCGNLSNVTLSKSLIRMGYYAFRDCDSLTSIIIPKSLQETTHINRVYQGVFADSDNLKTVFFAEGVSVNR